MFMWHSLQADLVERFRRTNRGMEVRRILRDPLHLLYSYFSSFSWRLTRNSALFMRNLNAFAPRRPTKCSVAGFSLTVSADRALVASSSTVISISLIVAFLGDLASRSRVPDGLFPGLFIVVIVWAFWAMLPDAARWIIHRSLIKKSDSHNGGTPQ